MTAGFYNPIQKFSQSVMMARDYLMQTSDMRLLGAMYNPWLQVFSCNMPDNYLGLQQGNAIFLNSNVLQNESPERISSIFLHELNHFSRQSYQNSIMEEIESKKIEEDFLDSKGMGMFDDRNEDYLIYSTVWSTYTGLPMYS